MRLTKEEILEQYPTWVQCKHDVVKAWYGDISFEKKEEKYKGKNCREYGTFIGSVCVDAEDNFIYGDINVKHRGKSYNVRAYVGKGFEITSNRGNNYYSFMTKDYPFPMPVCNKYKEIDEKTVQNVISEKLVDYGIGIQKLMEFVRMTYIENGSYNYTEQKLKEYYDKQPKDVSKIIRKSTYSEIYNALESSIRNFIEFSEDIKESDLNEEYDQYFSLVPDAKLVVNNLDKISTKVLELFIFTIKTFNYPTVVKEWIYTFQRFCIEDGKILQLKDQNDRLKNYVHFDASDKKPKKLGDFR